jgi:hypothetical protein
MRSMIFAVLLVGFGGIANASTVSYVLDKSNPFLGDDDFLRVTISDNANGADIDFRVDVSRDAFPRPGSNFGMDSFFFNYNQSLNVGVSNIVDIDPSAWDILTDKNTGGGFGKFEFSLKGDGATRTELLGFTIAGVDGDSVFDYAVGNADSSGEFFAAHVAGFNSSDITSVKVAGSTLAPVPLPAAAWLLPPALLGLSRFTRRKT